MAVAGGAVHGTAGGRLLYSGNSDVSDPVDTLTLGELARFLGSIAKGNTVQEATMLECLDKNRVDCTLNDIDVRSEIVGISVLANAVKRCSECPQY